MHMTLRACLLACLLVGSYATLHSEQAIANHLAGYYETHSTELCHSRGISKYNRDADLLNVTKEEEMQAQNLQSAAFEKQQWQEYWRDADWKNFKDERVKRQVMLLSVLGESAVDQSTLAKLNEHKGAMNQIYSTAKVCPYKKQNCDLPTEGLSLDQGIEPVISSSTDYDELTYMWVAWRNASGAKERKDFKKYVELSNLAAKENGFSDMGEMWRYSFETKNFVADMDKLWEQVKPLYLSLHSYVRGKLRGRYGDKMGDDGLIPANVLGNMWGQTWDNLYDLVVPYPSASPADVTAALNSQNYSVLRMFQTADDFYISLGLKKNDMCYDESKGAILTRPKNREMVCHASAWDFCDGKDFRIKMCTKINSEDFVTIHHEMGHIEYFQLYEDQPITFRKSANPGFTEAIGDTIALSVSTPQHLNKIGLLTNYNDTYESGINALMNTALKKVAFLPFGLLVDKWRWDVFSGVVNESEWNAHWWDLRKNIQGLKPPVARTERDFDPGAKYHVAADSMYISYFVSYILQFQLHKSLCVTAGQFDPSDPTLKPLYTCDIYKSKAAGSKLAKGLALGASKHWRDVLFVLTGERELDGSALLEYFAPLKEFLYWSSLE